jgi:hypothetical protein
MHYDARAGSKRAYPLLVILRSHTLSVRSPQVRFIVKGTKGTYLKHGMDVQESQLRVLSSPNAIQEKQYGVEPECLWGTIERIEADELAVTKLE